MSCEITDSHGVIHRVKLLGRTAGLTTPHGQTIGSFGDLMTQCGLGPCAFQKSSPSLGAWCSRPLGAHVSKGGRDTWRGCAEQ